MQTIISASVTDCYPNRGAVTAVRGSVVDVHFDRDLPHINTLLRTGRNEEIALEVATQLVYITSEV